MNDTAIIKSISTIHTTIVDLFVFIFVALFSIYFTLHLGLKLNKVILPGIEIEQLYIKWDEKIRINADSIYITKSNTKNSFDYSKLNSKNILRITHFLDTLFSEVIVKKIYFNKLYATFSYKEHHDAYINIYGPKLKFTGSINIHQDLIAIDIEEFNETVNNISLNGKLLVYTQKKQLFGDINLSIAETVALKLYLLSDTQKLKLWAKSSKSITKPIGPVVKLAHLGPLIDPWIIDQLKGKKLDIAYLKSTMNFDNPISALDSLSFKASYKDVAYVFAPGFAPAHSKHVDLNFKNRILYIYPRHATFYGQPGGTTWVKIDFKHLSNPLLTVDVDTTACLTPKLVAWLKGYGIALPFYQTAGKTEVKLGLWITLEDIDISAKGHFSTKKASFNFSDTTIDVKDVKVALHNTDVTISQLNATLLNKAIDVDLSGQFNPVKEVGRFDMHLNHLLFGKKESRFSQDQNHDPLKFSYILQPKKDRLIIAKSYWNFKDKNITLNPLQVPFNFATLSGSIPATLLKSDEMLSAYVSGQFNIKALSTQLSVDLLKFSTSKLSLDQLSLPMNLKYNKGLFVKIDRPSQWKLNDNKFLLKSTNISYADSLLTINDTHVGIADLLESTIEGSYNIQSGSGKIVLKQLHAKSGDVTLLDIKKETKIYIKKKKTSHILEVPVLNLKFHANSDGWNMSIKNMQLLSSYSPFLQENNITSGAIYFYSKAKQKKINFYGNFPFPYPILVQNNIPVNQIKFSGSYLDDLLNIYMNKQIQATFKYNHLDIKAKNIGISIFPILDFINDHSSNTNKKESSKLKIMFEAVNSYLYVNKVRRAPADKLKLEYDHNTLIAHLLYGKKGGAVLELNDKNELYLYGDHFNDTFMKNLAEFSNFEGGELSFYVNGKDGALNGVLKVTNTIVKDYKALNNTFAFINTIPALVTFSVPQYSSNGLKIDEGYAALHYKNGLLSIDGFHLDTPELKFNGKGNINTLSQDIDVEVSLITEASTNLSKIPFLGYILVGKDNNTSTTTLTLKGPMDNPVVNNTLAKDIGVGSFNIIRRALTFPIHYIEKAQTAIEKAEAARKKVY